MTTLKDLEKRVKNIESRNMRVESDKYWETSYFRRILLMVFTYLAISIYLFVIGLPEPWLNAIVPTIAFMLSTLTLPFFKKIWLKNIYKNKSQ